MLKNRFVFSLALLCGSLSAQPLGALLLQGNCVTCHHYTQAISAPSLTKIRENYKRAYMTEELFVEAVSNFVEKPNQQHSIMLEDIQKYQLMPELAFDRTTLKLISSYIYEKDFSKVIQP